MQDRNQKIVYIEDEPDMIELVRLILGRQGWEVIGANGGKEGLETVQREAPNLVLLDLMMPDMDGWEVYQHMKANQATRTIPVIVITANAQNMDRVFGLHVAKVDEYLTKPFSPKELIDCVQAVISRVEQ